MTDHVAATNHAINWDDTKIIDKEGHKTTRWLKEAIWIRRRGTNTMNKDEGAYKLNSIYDQLISSPPSTGLIRPYKNNRTSQKVASDEDSSTVRSRNVTSEYHSLDLL